MARDRGDAGAAGGLTQAGEVKAQPSRRQRLTQLHVAYSNALFAARGSGVVGFPQPRAAVLRPVFPAATLRVVFLTVDFFTAPLRWRADRTTPDPSFPPDHYKATRRRFCEPAGSRRWPAFRVHPSLSATMPTRITSAATARCAWKGSPSSVTPISAANTTEVSRRAATAAIGAWVIAQITTA
jgi:hypothetical protein